MHIVVMFPGQGGKQVVAEKKFYQHSAAVRSFFEQAEQITGLPSADDLFASQESAQVSLSTQRTQVALYTLSCALFAEISPLIATRNCTFLGHSLGLFSALFAAQSYSFTDGVALVSKRGQLMHQYGKSGTMLAVLKLSFSAVQKLLQEHEHHAPDVSWANYNSEHQIVLSGPLEQLKLLLPFIAQRGGRSLFLPVAGPFHSPAFQTAQQQFCNYLATVSLHDPQTTVYANSQATPLHTAAQVSAELACQMVKPVVWWPAVQQVAAADLFIQVGPGTVLAALIGRCLPDKRVITIREPGDVLTLKKYLLEDK